MIVPRDCRGLSQSLGMQLTIFPSTPPWALLVSLIYCAFDCTYVF